jgi:hypothetical protein
MATNPYFRPVRAAISSEGLAGSIYGTVTALAVVVAVSDYKADTLGIAMSAIGTVLALSISHGYANWIGMRPGGNSRADFRLVVSHEWPIIAAAGIVVLALAVPRLLGASENTAIDVCLWFGVGMLFALGFRASQRAGRSFKACLKLASFDSLIGVGIVLIKTLVH